MLCCGAAPSAAGEITGNIGLASEFMYRGVAQSFGPAVQGGVDYVHGSGLYAGAWLSNTNYPGGDGKQVRCENDLYGGWAADLGALHLDLGLTNYRFSNDRGLDTLEFSALAGAQGASLLLAYTRAYFGSGEPGAYGEAALGWDLREKLRLDATGGYSWGRGPQNVFGENYVSYGLSLGMQISAAEKVRLSLLGSDLDRSDVPEGRARLVLDYLYEFGL